MSKMALCGDEYRDGAQRTEPRYYREKYLPYEKNRKIKVKSLISVTAWVVALGMFIAYLFLERQWMLFTIDFAILLSCLLGISDPEEDRKSRNVYWIFLITRVMDVAIRLM